MLDQDPRVGRLEEKMIDQIDANIKTHENWSSVETINIKQFMEVIGNQFDDHIITANGRRIIESYRIGDEIKTVEWKRMCGIKARPRKEEYKRVGETMQELAEGEKV